MKELKLTKGKVSFVDDNLFDILDQYKWQYVPKTGYAEITMNKKKMYLHRFVLQLSNKNPDKIRNYTDHIDGNKLNNQIANLRFATASENMYNRKKTKANRSGFKGVCWNKLAKKWVAYIKKEKKQYYLGLFKDIDDAANAYKEAALKMHGEFANI